MIIRDYPFYLCNVYIESENFDKNKLPSPLLYENIIFAGDFNAKHVTLCNSPKNISNIDGNRFLTFTL